MIKLYGLLVLLALSLLSTKAFARSCATEDCSGLSSPPLTNEPVTIPSATQAEIDAQTQKSTELYNQLNEFSEKMKTNQPGNVQRLNVKF